VLDGVDNTNNASPLTTTTTSTTDKYTFLNGKDALETHGKYLVRVPTVRPTIIGSFDRSRIKEDDNDCSEENSNKSGKVNYRTFNLGK